MNPYKIPHVIVPFSEEYRMQAVECIMKVRLKDPTYPPQRDVTDIVTGDFNTWLMEEETTHRWVALVDGKVASHISLVEAHPYLTDHLDMHGEKPHGDKGYLEISKFFTNPEFQGKGIGTDLLRHAIHIALEESYTPALAVISTSVKAIEVYKKENMKQIGYFNGVHGKNFIFLGTKS
jgi:GNAT superfamily N-acetyltransferase